MKKLLIFLGGIFLLGSLFGKPETAADETAQEPYQTESLCGAETVSCEEQTLPANAQTAPAEGYHIQLPSLEQTRETITVIASELRKFAGYFSFGSVPAKNAEPELPEYAQ